ncbi:DUF1127 domain-containing protein [Bradyrhizobium sp. Arg816]|uniref:DUF1127 domain-containing protein n=1 Tax=Bradyrhizobium sp. Arg816 TaxID=2998491 RepID=UPI00249F102C|nr:DUF1127 domain-containing protein [Bradyrhizobium sp. Arg816]MDI3564025.1 DUF1127 domain-containing protein [Bradyrhizobium sp. Arg816]
MKKHSLGVSRVALPGNMGLDGANWVARSDSRGMVSLRAIAAGHSLPDIGSPSVAPPAAQDQPATTFWWAVFASVMEGFALYGAALHPTAAVPVQAMLDAVRESRPPSADRTPPAPAKSDGAGDSGNIVLFDRVPPRDARPARSWLHALGAALGTVMALPAHWRREWEIRRAVAGLMEFDDRTLRDIGINGRSEVERVVRYCRDC